MRNAECGFVRTEMRNHQVAPPAIACQAMCCTRLPSPGLAYSFNANIRGDGGQDPLIFIQNEVLVKSAIRNPKSKMLQSHLCQFAIDRTTLTQITLKQDHRLGREWLSLKIA